MGDLPLWWLPLVASCLLVRPRTRDFLQLSITMSPPPSLPLCQIRKNGQHGLMITPSYGFENPSFLRYITSFEPRVRERCDTRGT